MTELKPWLSWRLFSERKSWGWKRLRYPLLSDDPGHCLFGSLIFGFLADAIGNKRTILISLALWSFIVLWAYGLGVFWDPRTEYWILGVLTALVLEEAKQLPIASRGLHS